MSIPPLSFAANSCFTLGRDNGIDVLIVLVGLEGCERFLRFLVEHLAGPREFHRPINKRHHRRAERFSKLGEFVFHFRWKLRMNCSLYQLALLQSSKLLRQHALRDAGGGVFEFREAPDRPREKAVQNHDLPFAFEDRERRLNSLGSLELKGRRPES